MVLKATTLSKEKETSSIINLNLNVDSQNQYNNEELIVNSEDEDFIDDNEVEFNNSDELERLINNFDNLNVSNNDYNNKDINNINLSKKKKI